MAQRLYGIAMTSLLYPVLMGVVDMTSDGLTSAPNVEGAVSRRMTEEFIIRPRTNFFPPTARPKGGAQRLSFLQGKFAHGHFR